MGSALHVPPAACVKSEAFVPVTVSAVIIREPGAGFENVTLTGDPAVPWVWLPNGTGMGDG